MQGRKRGEEEKEEEGGGGEEFYSIAHGKVDWSSFTKHPFYIPGSPQNTGRCFVKKSCSSKLY